MNILLPQEKTYIPGPLRCIYCTTPDPTVKPEDLSREHIVPKKLGGKLVLHHASCKRCAGIINKQIETPILAHFLRSPRTHLGMPTSKPQTTLPIGRWISDKTGWPEDMDNVNFRFDQVAVRDHPFRLILPVFSPPGILWDLPPSDKFRLIKIQAHRDSRLLPQGIPGERTAVAQQWSPDIILKFIAKIAHGAAVAELGLDNFSPLLPSIILGDNTHIAYLSGSAKKTFLTSNTHEITLTLRRGYIVSYVHLFSKYLRYPYITVVGRPNEPLARWHTSAFMRSAIPA